jgi:hypothetical protein
MRTASRWTQRQWDDRLDQTAHKEEIVALLKHRAFLLLVVGQTSSLLADWALRAALLIWVYALTRSAVAVSLVGLCEAIPMLLIAPFADVYVDRWHRGRTMAAALLVRALALLPLLAIHGQDGLPLVLALPA